MNPVKNNTTKENEYIVTPTVFDRAAGKDGRPLSEEERRARELVESIERDLFGTRASSIFPDRVEESEAVEESDESTVGEVREIRTNGEQEAIYERTLESFSPSATGESAKTKNVKLPPESTEEEFRFLLDMDYEKELGDAIGFEWIRSYHEGEMNGKTTTRKRAHAEFETQLQETSFRREYEGARKMRLAHLAFSVVMLLFIVLYERSALMARTFGGPFDGSVYPTAYTLIGVQLLLLEAAFFAKPLWEGLIRLCKFSPTDYSFTSVLVIGTFVYHYILLLLPTGNAAPALYLSPAAFSLALLAFVKFLDWRRESLAYDVVASRRDKYALVRRVSVGGEQDNAKDRLLRADFDRNEYYPRRVEFVRNYFANTAHRMEHHRNLGAHILLTLAFGVAFGLVSFAKSASVTLSFRTVFATVLMAAPCASLLLTSLPLFFSAVLRQRGKSAIVGERPVAECADPATVVLPDDEIFEAMEHERFHLVEQSDIHTITALSRAMLEKLGSPLASAFGVDEGSRIDPARLRITDISYEGAAAVLDEDGANVLFGTISYMKENGISVRGLADDIPVKVYNRLHCIAVNGKVAALSLVRYRFQKSALALFSDMKRTGVPIAIRTKDPCVREEVLSALLQDRGVFIKVIRPTVQEMELRTDRVDATVVALDSAMEAARAYVCCRLVARASSVGKLMQTLSMVLGGAISALLMMLGTAPSALLVTMWLMVWCVLYMLPSYSLLCDGKGKKKHKIFQKRST